MLEITNFFYKLCAKYKVHRVLRISLSDNFFEGMKLQEFQVFALMKNNHQVQSYHEIQAKKSEDLPH